VNVIFLSLLLSESLVGLYSYRD